MTHDIELLTQPISAVEPCGTDLEYSPLLSGLDAYRLFGSDLPLSADIAWREVRDQSLVALAQSHDLRLLAYLAAATVRIDGLIPFCQLIAVAERWLGEYWDPVFPRIDEDAILRRNALNSFADRMAIVDAVRRAPVASHRQLGTFSLRDLELATRQLTPTELDTQPLEQAQIEAILAAAPGEDLAQLSAALQAGMDSLRKIIVSMQTRAGFESAPDFDLLLRPLSRIDKLLTDHVPQAASAPTAAPTDEATPAMPTGPVTDIKSRQDAIRALDAVATFFRTHEPSSPVPMFVERAKRLVSKTFMEVLADIAPESITQAKLIGGIQNDESQ